MHVASGAVGEKLIKGVAVLGKPLFMPGEFSSMASLRSSMLPYITLHLCSELGMPNKLTGPKLIFGRISLIIETLTGG